MRNENIYQSIMPAVYIVTDNILSPIGDTTAANFRQIKKGISGIEKHHDEALSDEPVYASLFAEQKNKLFGINKLDDLLIASIKDALKNSGINPIDNKTVLIISSTKGNINLLESNGDDRDLADHIAMYTTAKVI